MKNLLVPVDFSQTAANAADYAVELAKAFNGEITLLHIYHVPIPVSAAAPITAISGNELQAINETLIKKEADRISLSGIKVNTIVTIGSVVHEILEQSKAADIIVIGMKGSGFIKEKLIGSTATSLLTKTAIPMVVIPEDATFKSPQNILLACDYDSHSDLSTLDHLQLFISTLGLKLYVVSVKNNKELPPLGEATEAAIRHETRDGETIFYFPENADPVEGINTVVKAINADIVALIPHHYHLAEGLFHQSISRKMAFHTDVPLLILPEKTD